MGQSPAVKTGSCGKFAFQRYSSIDTWIRFRHCPLGVSALVIEHLSHNGILLAIIISDRFCERGVHFFTDPQLSQQLAYMRHQEGKVIAPHFHNKVARQVFFTQEVLFIKRGRLRVDFYDQTRHYLDSRVLEAGDTILLSEGGHGFEILEEIEMIEVKQGPYSGDSDKTVFVPSTDDQQTGVC
jgi:mannose-6-phosphate isomerase-like protein (cupin superfamily)